MIAVITYSKSQNNNCNFVVALRIPIMLQVHNIGLVIDVLVQIISYHSQSVTQ